MNESRKRKRVITSCVECYRRKQKCDRKHPTCNVCSAREVTCSYVDSAYVPPGPELPDNRASRRKRAEPSDGRPNPTNLSEQVGYSQRIESNALKALEKSLPDQKPLIVNMKSSRSLMLNYLKDRFSATVAFLPDQDIIGELVDVFFVEANTHVGVLDRYFFHKAEAAWNSVNSTFLRTCKLEGLTRDTLYFPAVLFQVLAVSLQYMTIDSKATKMLNLSDYSQLDGLSQKYTQHGMDIMKLLGRHSPNVMSVQHDLMRSLWAKNVSNGTEAWYILGDAIRQAQDIGLHLQSELPDEEGIEKTLEDLWYDEWKRRLWVSLFNWDAHLAMVLGRPRSINAGDCTVDAPLDCNMPNSPPTTVLSEATMGRTPSLYTRHIFNYFISHKIHEMLFLGANRRYIRDYNIVRRLSDDVLRKLDELPPTARPNNPDTFWDATYPYLPKQRGYIATIANSFLVALHRPHAPMHEDSRRAAIFASLASLEAQQRVFEVMSSSHYRTFGASFYTIDASLFLSTAILENAPADPDLLVRINDALSHAIERLNVMKYRSPMAESGVKVLERCFDKFQQRQARINYSVSQSLTSRETTRSTSGLTNSAMDSNGHNDNHIDDTAPEYTDFEWAFPANNTDPCMDFDSIGNVTDFNTSFWTDQMASILNSNADPAPNDGSLWQFL